MTDLAYAFESFVLFGISVGPAGHGHGWQHQHGRETASPKHGQPGKGSTMIIPFPGLELLPVSREDADFCLMRRRRILQISNLSDRNHGQAQRAGGSQKNSSDHSKSLQPSSCKACGDGIYFLPHSNGSISSGIRPNWSAIKSTTPPDHQQIRNNLPWWQPCLKVELLELFGSI